MWLSNNKHEGLVLTQSVIPVQPDGPLLDGPDVSWMNGLTVGDNQGNHGACSLFTFANWAERVRGIQISDEETIAVYLKTLRSLAMPANCGITNPQAFRAAKTAGWLGDATSLQAVRNLSALRDQPVIGGFEVTDALRNTNSAGCMDHAASPQVYGYHDMLIVASGRQDHAPDELTTWILNSWGLKFGLQGMCCCQESLFRTICKELWIIR